MIEPRDIAGLITLSERTASETLLDYNNVITLKSSVESITTKSSILTRPVSNSCPNHFRAPGRCSH